MKILVIVMIAYTLFGCSTVDMAKNKFYKDVVDSYCEMGPVDRRFYRAQFNYGQDNRVLIHCLGDPDPCEKP